MAQGENPDWKLPWAHPITTRDGTLNTDSKLVNCLFEADEEGKTVIKRPGLSLISFQSGFAQGQFICGGTPFCIVSDRIINTQTLQSFAIPGVTVPFLQYDHVDDVPLNTTVIKSVLSLWKVTWDGTTFTILQVTDANYPTTTKRGIVYLDGIYYVMAFNGEVNGSNLEDPLTWPALNFIRADLSLGQGMGIARHLNYVLAFYQQGLQAYYDANATIPTAGTPLGPVGNASWTTGCAVDSSIIELTDMSFFISRDRVKGITIQQMVGLSLQQVSTTFVEKILNRSNLSGIRAVGIRTAGHSLYIVSLPDIQASLVYDLTTQQWTVWTSQTSDGIQQAFIGGNYLSFNEQDWLQDMSTGSILWMDQAFLEDNAISIPVTMVTPNLAWGTMSLKRIAAAYLMADTVDTTVFLSYSDDDYQTWSTPRAIDLSTVRKMLNRLGASRRRAWKLTHSDNTSLKVSESLLDVAIGPG